MTKFEVNKAYYCKSVCDSNCVWTYTVTKRTDKSIWLDNGKRYGVHVFMGVEAVYPEGKYSLCPVLHADNMEVK